MLELLNQGWIGSILGFLGIIVGLLLYRSSKIGARPTCQMKSLRLIGGDEQALPSEIEIRFKDKNIPRITNTKIITITKTKEIIAPILFIIS